MPKRRGFAMATAISFIPLATMAMVSVGMLCAFDCGRTASVAEGAQLRQMLLAAAVDARGHLPSEARTSSTTAAWITPLPSELGSNGAKLQTEMIIDSDRARLTINATFGDRHAAEQMKFVRDQDRWVAVAVQLIDTTN